MRTILLSIIGAVLMMANIKVFAQDASLPTTTASLKLEGIDFSRADSSVAIRKLMNEIPQMEPMLYPDKIASFRETFENYFEYKKEVCNGAFTTMIVDEKEGVKQNKSLDKLSKEEKSLCVKDLKELHVGFINNMFIWRKKYLDYVHEQRLNELNTIKQNSINEIQRSYEKR